MTSNVFEHTLQDFRCGNTNAPNMICLKGKSNAKLHPDGCAFFLFVGHGCQILSTSCSIEFNGILPLDSCSVFEQLLSMAFVGKFFSDLLRLHTCVSPVCSARWTSHTLSMLMLICPQPALTIDQD